MIRTFIAFIIIGFSIQAATAQQAFFKSTDDLRLYNHTRYKLVDAAHFPIYARQVHVTGSKARVTETRYYFSLNQRSPIMPLTISNLKRAFPEYTEFHDLLDLQFAHSRELMKYDPYYSEYTIKKVFRKGIS